MIQRNGILFVLFVVATFFFIKAVQKAGDATDETAAIAAIAILIGLYVGLIPMLKEIPADAKTVWNRLKVKTSRRK